MQYNKIFSWPISGDPEKLFFRIRRWEGQVKIDNCEETDSSKNNNGNPLKGTKEGKNEKEIH